MPDYEVDRQQSARWAYELIKRPNWCVLDTETTGLSGTDEICQVAVVDNNGTTLLDTLVRPTVSIHPEAMRIHGITGDMVQNAKTFPEVFLDLWKAVGDRELIIYNAEFDLRLIRQSLLAWRMPLFLHQREHSIMPPFKKDSTLQQQCPTWLNGAPVQCAMRFYSQWCGVWNSHYGNYRWQKLPGGDHTAVGDCIATLKVIKQMAEAFEVAETAPAVSGEYDDAPF